MRRQFKVKVESALFERSYTVEAESARGAACLATGEYDLSVARGTVETPDRAVFKDRFSPRVTVTLVEAGAGD